MTLAHAGHVGNGCWTIHVAGATRTTDAGVLVVDVARAMGATHVRFRDAYDSNGCIYLDPFAVVQEIPTAELPVSL